MTMNPRVPIHQLRRLPQKSSGHMLVSMGLFLSLLAVGYWGNQQQQQREQFEREIGQLNVKLNSTERMLSLKSKQRDRYRTQTKDLTQQLAALEKKNQAFSELTAQAVESGVSQALAVSKEAQADQINTIASLESQLEQLVEVHQADKDAHNENKARLENAISQLETRIKMAHLLIAEHEIAQSALTQSNSELERQIKDQLTQGETFEARISALTTQLKASKAHITEMTDKLAAQEKLALQAQKAATDTGAVEVLAASELTAKAVQKAKEKVVVKEKYGAAELDVLQVEREKLIAVNQELVVTLTQLQGHQADLKTRNKALEQDVLSLSHQLREVRLSEKYATNKLFADR